MAKLPLISCKENKFSILIASSLCNLYGIYVHRALIRLLSILSPLYRYTLCTGPTEIPTRCGMLIFKVAIEEDLYLHYLSFTTVQEVIHKSFDLDQYRVNTPLEIALT